jgi:hypothetical protein
MRWRQFRNPYQKWRKHDPPKGYRMPRGPQFLKLGAQPEAFTQVPR